MAPAVRSRLVQLPALAVSLPVLWALLVNLPALQSRASQAVQWIIRLLIVRKRSQCPGGRHTCDGPQPLQDVVARCEGKWLLENLQEAVQTGSIKAMREAQRMLEAGFGSKQPPEVMKSWAEQAWSLYEWPANREVPGHCPLQRACESNRAGQESGNEPQQSQLHFAQALYEPSKHQCGDSSHGTYELQPSTALLQQIQRKVFDDLSWISQDGWDTYKDTDEPVPDDPDDTEYEED